MSDLWDQRYAEPGYKYGTEPNAFLRGQAQRLGPGSRVLVPGDGDGRNGVWLAQQGHRVLSVDQSAVGQAKARALAAERGASLDTLCTDLADWAPEAASADAVVLVYCHLPAALRRAVHRRLAEALVPGGWLILECFEPAQLGLASGGPRERDMLPDLAALREDFAGRLDEQLGWQGAVQLDEGPSHRGPAQVVRYVGRRGAPDTAVGAA